MNVKAAQQIIINLVLSQDMPHFKGKKTPLATQSLKMQLAYQFLISLYTDSYCNP